MPPLATLLANLVLAYLCMSDLSIEYHQARSHSKLSPWFKICPPGPFQFDDAVKSIEANQLAREGTEDETADEREVVYGDQPDSASDADKDGGSYIEALPLLLLTSEGEASSSAGPSPLLLHGSSHSPPPSSCSSPFSTASAAQLSSLEDSEPNRYVSSLLSL